MKTGKKRIFYWDANVFIAWLKGETYWPSNVIIGMTDVAREVSEGRAILCTSAVTKTEILQGTLTQEQKTKLADLMQRSNVVLIAADERITDRASAIREHYNTKGNKIKTPDAIHLATAILYKADEMQTMDGLDTTGGDKKTKLLSLSGNVAGYDLLIVNPYPLHTPPEIAIKVEGPLFPPEEKPITKTDVINDKPGRKFRDFEESKPKRETDPAHPPTVRGGDGGRAQGETAGEAQGKAAQEETG